MGSLLHPIHMDTEVQKIAERCSKRVSQVKDTDLIHLLPYMEGFLNRTWLAYQISQYEAWGKTDSDPALQSGLLHRPLGFNMLVAGLWSARYWEEQQRRPPPFRLPMGAKWLLLLAADFAVLELHAGDRMDKPALEHVRQRLQASDNVWGLLHEVRTFGHFLCKGAQVEPNFLSKASPKELTILWDGAVIPVQCKAKRPGAGRAISQEVFTNLAASIGRDVKKKQRQALIRIGSTGTIRHADIEFLRKAVNRELGQGKTSGPVLYRHGDRTFSLVIKPVNATITVDNAREFLHGFDAYLAFLAGDPTPGGEGFQVDAVDAIVVIDSHPDEQKKAWTSLNQSINDASRQLKGGPPGIVAVHYVDPVPSFEMLCPEEEPMLFVMTKKIHNSPHIAGVLLSTEPALHLPGQMGPSEARCTNRP